MGNLTIQRREPFCREEVILLLSCNDEGEFDLDVVYKEENARKYEMEPFADLAEDSEFTAKQRNYIISKLTNFYNEKKDNPRANIKDLQEEYLT